jgi:hypothetical protein
MQACRDGEKETGQKEAESDGQASKWKTRRAESNRSGTRKRKRKRERIEGKSSSGKGTSHYLEINKLLVEVEVAASSERNESKRSVIGWSRKDAVPQAESSCGHRERRHEGGPRRDAGNG